MITFKRGVKFLLHKRNSSDTKNISIRMRVTMQGETPIDFPIGCSVDVAFWDSDNFIVYNGYTNKDGNTTTTINEKISFYKQAALDAFARYDYIEKRKPTKIELKDLINDLCGKKTILQTIIEQKTKALPTFDNFVGTMSKQNEWAKNMTKKFGTMRNHLLSLSPDIDIDDINDKWLQDYIEYMERKGYNNTTTAKYFSYFKWFLKWSNQKGYYNGKSHETFTPRFKGISPLQKEIIYLSPDELKQFNSFDFSGKYEHLGMVRDVFVFLCFTGLRYSDAAKLKRSDIKNGTIKVVTQKTVDALTIELNDQSQAILDKYKEVIFPNDLALPIISNQKMNEYLHLAGQIAGLDEPTRKVYFNGKQRIENVFPKYQLLTTHCGRRTFVVTALLLGITSDVIMRWTGHSSFSAMKPYIKIVDELKQREMKKFNGFLQK